MKLSQYKQDYYQFSGLASSTSRQLAFAGIALIWIFKSQHGASYELPNELLVPSALLIASLGSDLIQYVAGSMIWGVFHRYHERKRINIEDDPNIEAPYYFTWPIIFFFCFKVLAVLLAYCLLLKFAIKSINFIS